MSRNILEKLELIHCHKNENASVCVDTMSNFLDYTKAAAIHYSLSLPRAKHTMSMCEPCFFKTDLEICNIKPFPKNDDVTCGSIKQHIMTTFTIAGTYDISASKAYEVISMCRECISGEKTSVCSDTVEGIECSTIRNDMACKAAMDAYVDKGCDDSSSDNTCVSLREDEEKFC